MIPPPADETGLINTFYLIETGGGSIAETVPAYSAQIFLMVRGQVTFTYADGSTAQSSTVTINAPQLRSADSVLEGPVLQVGASLTHIAWQKLANLPADEVHDQLIPASSILTPEQIASLEAATIACREGRIAPEELCRHLSAVIASGRFAPRADHVAVVESVLRWLASGFDPVLADLHAEVGISPRQLQRICRRFFGAAPAQVLKRFRAHRAAMVLSQPGISAKLFDELMATYFDQAHLIRDMRRYTGRTPSQLRRQTLGNGMLDPAAHGDAGAVLHSGED
ncbi:helix-turn-helix domain-containing protein [Porphyrobacter sp. AAP60]|uniref:helix-turn-helix domain-containing protein n=1 Tax=Porphyrobacter sp. AAP60 TaxID=1523423 RepID=UPI0006B8D8D9|nr:helix-turn-helix domain-containing protein [Porphyrobacter sp. AAP60]KPF63885.1 hypothetical protein IP79_08705 [Porphyrobacter sp. AAP60]